LILFAFPIENRKRNQSKVTTPQASIATMARDDDDDDEMPIDDQYNKADIQSMVEEEYHEALEDMVYAKMEAISEMDDDAWLDLSDAEHQILLSMNNTGLFEGSMAGLVTLVSLRLARRALFRPRTMASGGGGRAMTTTNTPSSFPSSPITAARPPPSSSSSGGGTFRQQMDRLAHSRVGMVLGWLTDVAIGGTVAAFVADACLDEEEMLRDVADIPLLPGESAIARHFCPVVQDALLQLSRQATTPAETAALTRPRTPQMAAWLTFSHNCQLRQAQEELIRRQQGLSADAIVSIPPPGVSSSSSDMLDYDAHSLSSGEFPSAAMGPEHGGDDNGLYENDYDHDDGSKSGRGDGERRW
jgi:hypothetical protein